MAQYTFARRTVARRLAAAALISALSSPAAYGTDLTVSVSDIKTADGQLMLRLAGSEQQLADANSAIASLILTPDTAGVSFTLHNVPAGTYGIQLFHDENGNNKLDANLIGIPKEPWAFSNNAAGRFGPPKWQDIRFEISAEDAAVTQDISLNQ